MSRGFTYFGVSQRVSRAVPDSVVQGARSLCLSVRPSQLSQSVCHSPSQSVQPRPSNSVRPVIWMDGLLRLVRPPSALLSNGLTNTLSQAGRKEQSQIKDSDYQDAEIEVKVEMHEQHDNRKPHPNLSPRNLQALTSGPEESSH